MYAEGCTVCGLSGHTEEAHQGLGFWSALIPVGVAVGKRVFSGDPNKLDVDVYYPAVKAGQLVVPGRFDIATVASALDYVDRFQEPGRSVHARVDSKLREDGAWVRGQYAPLRNSTEKASALVNWAHGGRDQQIKGHEAEISGILDDLLEAADAQARAEAAELQAQQAAAAALQRRVAADRAGELVAGVPASALALGAAGLAAVLFLARR